MTGQIPGGFLVQWTDEAKQQFVELPDDLQERIDREIGTASAINPRLRGVVQDGIRDRIRLNREQGVSALVWLSEDLKILTVVEVRQEAVAPVRLRPDVFSTDGAEN